ncbi:MAG: glycosyltransferase family 2 protein [Saprospiraceae bacterium]|nr:glycosyltransferase family 2 protein [Saprospiraceae bacterium]
MQQLSVIITTFNEADNIAGVLASVDWADEIIVVDSFSTDNTTALAQQHPKVRLLQRKYIGPSDQKNWAIPQAKHEWILLLDADERVTPTLRSEIEMWLGRGSIPYDAFWIGRNNHFLGQRINYSGWQGDAVVRFFRRDVCRYDDKQVHEEIVTEGLRVSRLNQKMEHFTFKSAAHFLDKVNRYAMWSAQDYARKTPAVTLFHLCFKPFFRFFKHFILQRGFLDGRTGFVVCAILAWSVFLRYLYLLEKQMPKPVDR